MTTTKSTMILLNRVRAALERPDESAGPERTIHEWETIIGRLDDLSARITMELDAFRASVYASTIVGVTDSMVEIALSPVASATAVLALRIWDASPPTVAERTAELDLAWRQHLEDEDERLGWMGYSV